MSWLLSTIYFVALFVTIESADISPTSGNSTYRRYITSEIVGDFQNGTIDCDGTTCHIICDEAEGCRQITVNAGSSTQLLIECSAPRTCMDAIINSSAATTNVDITCTSNASTSIYNGACFGTQIYLQNAETVTIAATGNYAMKSANIFADNVENGVDITCTDRYTCRDMKLHAENIQSNLTVNCDGYSSCFRAGIYCPVDKECNINCGVTIGSGNGACDESQFYVPSRKYGDGFNLFNLDCPDGSPNNYVCDGADIVCMDTGDNTAMRYSSIIGGWECLSQICCPLNKGKKSCSVGSECTVNCTAGCKDYVIDGRLATSLTVDCTGVGCENAGILCPIGNGTSCIIQCDGGFCQDAYIKTADSNTMTFFNLDCGSADGTDCKYIDLFLESESIESVDIICNNTAADICDRSVFNVNTDVTNRLKLDCLGNTQNCRRIEFNLDETSTINDLDITCSGSYACRGATFNIAGTVTNKFDLICSFGGCNNLYKATSALLFDLSLASINYLSLTCLTNLACSKLDIKPVNNDGTIDTFDINCVAESACSELQIYPENIPNGNKIYINNSANVDCLASYACSYARLAFFPTTSEVNMNINCGSERACNNMPLFAYDMGEANITCSAPYACYGNSFVVGTVDKVHVECSDEYSCSNRGIYCPYEQEASCVINCEEATNTCYDLNIYVPGTYKYGYLELMCPSRQLYADTTACGTTNDGLIDVSCVTGDRDYIRLSYDGTVDDYVCLSNGAIEESCCPYNNTSSGPSSTETESTSNPTTTTILSPTISSPTIAPNTHSVDSSPDNANIIKLSFGTLMLSIFAILSTF